MSECINHWSLSAYNTMLLHVPRSHLKLCGDLAFAITGPKLWNDLPMYLREIPSSDRFKTELKTHLFRKAYDNLAV